MDDGWIEWTGGECPVRRETLVDVRYRDGDRESGFAAGRFWWTHNGEDPDLEITAYRIHS